MLKIPQLETSMERALLPEASNARKGRQGRKHSEGE